MNKANILLPLNGLGERFKDFSNTPKPLIRINDKEMIFHLLDNLNYNFIDQIIVPYNHILDDYGFQHLLKDRYKNVQFQFLSIKEKTRGAAETIVLSLSSLPQDILEKKIITMDCDTFYFEDVLKSYFQSGYKNCIFYFVDESKKEIFSYIQLQNNKVIEIKEKQKISNFANCGIFCFESGNFLKSFADSLIKSNIKQKNEFYISGICDIILSEKHTINALEVKKFACVGTPIQLQDYIKGQKQ